MLRISPVQWLLTVSVLVLGSWGCVAPAPVARQEPATPPAPEQAGPPASSAPVAPGAVPLDQALQKLAETVAVGLAPWKDQTGIAVFPLTGPDGEGSYVGRYAAEQVTGLLAGRGYTVVDRDRQDYLMRELEFQSSGLTDGSTGARLGRTLGADVLVTGTVRDLDGWLELALRLTDVETSEVLGQAGTRVARDEQLKPLLRREQEQTAQPAGRTRLDESLELAFTVVSQRRSGDAWEQVDASDGAIVRNGDQIQFHLAANRACNAYLLAYGSSGRLSMVFPNPAFGHSGSAIQAGQDIQVPPRGNPGGEWITIEPPAGTETFFALATLEEFSNRELAGLIARMEAAGGGLSVQDSSVAVGAMTGLAKQVNADAEFRQEVEALAEEIASSATAGGADSATGGAPTAGDDSATRGSVQVIKRDLGGVAHTRVEQFQLSGGHAVEQLVQVIHGTAEVVQRVSLRHE